MQVGLHSEPQNIWLDAGTRQPDISSLHHEPVAPLSLRRGSQPEGADTAHTLCFLSSFFRLWGTSFLFSFFFFSKACVKISEVSGENLVTVCHERE